MVILNIVEDGSNCLERTGGEKSTGLGFELFYFCFQRS